MDDERGGPGVVDSDSGEDPWAEWERHADLSVNRFLLEQEESLFGDGEKREPTPAQPRSYLTDALAVELPDDDSYYADGLFWFGAAAEAGAVRLIARDTPSPYVDPYISRAPSPAPPPEQLASPPPQEVAEVEARVAAEPEPEKKPTVSPQPATRAERGRSQLEAMLGISRSISTPTRYVPPRQQTKRERRPVHTGGATAPTQNWALSPQRAAAKQLVDEGVLLPMRNANAFALTRTVGPKAQLHQVVVAPPPLKGEAAPSIAPPAPSRRTPTSAATKKVQVLPPLAQPAKGALMMTTLPLLRPRAEAVVVVTPAEKRKALIEKRTKAIAAMNRQIHLLEEADRWNPPSRLEGQPETSSLQWTFTDPTKLDVLQRRACALATKAARDMVSLAINTLCILCTVTFRANPAHNLTRYP